MSRAESTRRRMRRGVTVVELMVTIAIIGFITAMVSLAMPSRRAPTPNAPLDQIAAARHRAVTEARSVTIAVAIDGQVVNVTALADGSVIADSAARIDRMTGRSVDAKP